MNRAFRVLLAASIFALPLSATARPLTMDLVSQLEASQAGYNNPWFYFSGKLTVDTAVPNDVIIKAFNNLNGLEQSMSLNDMSNLVISSLNASDADVSGYLEKQIGISDQLIRVRLNRVLEKGPTQALYEKYSNAVKKTKIAVIAGATATLGAGLMAVAIPLAFTGVGIIPAIMLAEVGAGALGVSASMVNSLTNQNKAVLQSNIALLMTGILGAEQAEPGAKISWLKFNYRPMEEIMTHLKRSEIAKQVMMKFAGKRVLEMTDKEKAIFLSAQTSYARDIFLTQTLLSVMSRQVAGLEPQKITPMTLLRTSGEELLAALVIDLSAEEMASMTVAVKTLSDNRDVYLGMQGFRGKEGLEARREEIKWTVATLQTMLELRSSGQMFRSVTELERAALKAMKRK